MYHIDALKTIIPGELSCLHHIDAHKWYLIKLQHLWFSNFARNFYYEIIELFFYLC